MTHVVRKPVVALDALTFACALATIALAFFGSIRQYVFGVPVTIGWSHAAFATIALTLLRHGLSPSPSALATFQAAAAAVSRRPALRDALLAFWLTRPTVLLVGLLAVTAIGPAPSAAAGVGRDPLATLAGRFDAGWYADIAYEGYEWQRRFDRQQNLAFFPALPLLMRGAGALVGPRADATREEWVGRYTRAGLAISLAAFFWAAWYLSRIAREFLDGDRATAAVLLLAAYPFAIFYSAAYTEALFLLAAAGAWFHFRHDEWWKAASWGLVAGLSRPNGFLLAVPLGLVALGMRDAPRAANSDTPRKARNTVAGLATAATPIVGMLLFTIYIHQVTDVWFAWARMHGAWGRSLGGGVSLAPVGSAAGLLHWAAAHPFQALNTAGLAFALALVWPVWSKLGPAWAAFVLVMVLPPLAAGGVLSMGRLSSTLFPTFLALAAVLSSRAAIACVALFGIGQGLAATLFFTWRELF